MRLLMILFIVLEEPRPSSEPISAGLHIVELALNVNGKSYLEPSAISPQLSMNPLIR